MGRFSRAARQGDSCKGRCDIKRHDEHHHCSHRNTGRLAGSCNVFVNGLPAQKVGDAVFFEACQHSGVGEITEGSSTVFICKKPAARIKDSCTCQNPMCGREQVITTGSNNVYFG